jgi:uncharacterized protein (TIGR02757 family)
LTTAPTHFREILEDLYTRLNRPEFIAPDPLEFVLAYDKPADQEVVGLIASSLAFGGVKQIVGSVSRVLERLRNPSADIDCGEDGALEALFADWRHRWVSGRELAMLLRGIGRVRAEYGSLQACFLNFLDPGAGTVHEALSGFAGTIRGMCGGETRLLPAPERGSACKRLHLYLRWMVRRDDVDVGIWQGVPASKLLVPLDVHMHRIARRWGFTRRRQADLTTAKEVTEAFRRIAPEDPVRYDFALTRLGIGGRCPCAPEIMASAVSSLTSPR